MRIIAVKKLKRLVIKYTPYNTNAVELLKLKKNKRIELTITSKG